MDFIWYPYSYHLWILQSVGAWKGGKEREKYLLCNWAHNKQFLLDWFSGFCFASVSDRSSNRGPLLRHMHPFRKLCWWPPSAQFPAAGNVFLCELFWVVWGIPSGRRPGSIEGRPARPLTNWKSKVIQRSISPFYWKPLKDISFLEDPLTWFW